MDVTVSNKITFWDLFELIYVILVARFGFILRNCSDVTLRKWSCTSLGLLSMAVLMRTNMWHLLLAGVITIYLIQISGPRYCHMVALTISFSYLSIFRWLYFQEGVLVGIFPNLMQAMATLGVVGIAFEKNLAYKRKIGEMPNKDVDPTEDDVLELSFSDIFHYVFCYTAIVSGPYVRYQVYRDFIKLPFSRAFNRTRHNFSIGFFWMPTYLICFAVANIIWPIEYVITQEFADRSFFYRVTYCVLQWFRFRLFMYGSFCITDLFTTTAGLGAYPVENKSKVAHGITANKNNLRNITYEEALVMDLEINQGVTDVIEFETLPKIATATRHWNKAIQYWLGIYIYRSLPKKYFNQPARVFITFGVSTLWHGIYPSLFLSSSLNSYFYVVESVWIQIQKDYTGWKYGLFDIGFWISRTYFWAYTMMSYMILDLDSTLNYFKLTYFGPVVYTVFMHILGKIIILMKRNRQKNNKIIQNNNLTFRMKTS